MTARRILHIALLVAIPVTVATLFVARPASKVSMTHRPKTSILSAKKDGHFVPPEKPEPPAPPHEIAQAVEKAQIRSSYDNYRTAVATGNQPLADSLLRVLGKNREYALECAEEALARAGTARDRSVAQETIQALRR